MCFPCKPLCDHTGKQKAAAPLPAILAVEIRTLGDCFLSVCAGYEGRAGMAALVLKKDLKLDGKKLYDHLVKTLPAYAWPRFLRIQVSHASS